MARYVKNRLIQSNFCLVLRKNFQYDKYITKYNKETWEVMYHEDLYQGSLRGKA